MLGMLSSKTEVGLYEACEGICQIPGAFIFALEGVMLPRMSNLWANKDEELRDNFPPSDFYKTHIFIKACPHN